MRWRPFAEPGVKLVDERHFYLAEVVVLPFIRHDGLAYDVRNGTTQCAPQRTTGSIPPGGQYRCRWPWDWAILFVL